MSIIEKPVRFIECLLPVSICNLNCSYCYIIQEDRRKMKLAELEYPPEHIAKALSKQRLGGTCLISICGAGETLAQKEIIPIVKLLLKEGHYVNITTNGTLTQRFTNLIDECKEYTKHLHFSFSFHYTELLRLNLIDTFFSNINFVRKNECSFLLQINLCDEYIPYIEEIKKISYEKVGAFPQVALTRNETTNPMSIMTNLTESEYKKIGKSFHSPLFDFTCNNFNVKRKEFCYAGDWSAVLNLQSGWMSSCYRNTEGQNIFENIEKPIDFKAVGKNCKNLYCVNSSHFMSLGVIPSIKCPTYAQLRNRKEANWYTDEMYSFLNNKLDNKKYGFLKKFRINHQANSFREFMSTFEFYQKLHDIKNKH